jgi:hypothetical protein
LRCGSRLEWFSRLDRVAGLLGGPTAAEHIVLNALICESLRGSQYPG